MLSRPIARALALAGIVAILALGAVFMASAAPAEVTTYHACYPDGESGDTICFTIHDVEKEQSNKSGKTQSNEAGSMLVEYFDSDGNLLWSDQTRWHVNVIEKDGETQVYHDQRRFEYTEGDETCTNESFAHFANGEIRHLGPEWQWVCN